MPAQERRPLELAAQLLELARRAGAEQADAVAVASTNSSTEVRMQRVEKIEEAASRAVGLRVIVDGRQAVVSTSDVTDAALAETAQTALELARVSEPDPHAGLPDPTEQAGRPAELGLFDEAIAELDGEERARRALACEQAALDASPQIGNSGGAAFNTRLSAFALADSNGFAGEYRGASASLYVEVMAQEEDSRLRNAGWFTAARQLHRLEDEASVGREAAARALRQLGAEKGETREAPVVWEPRMAAGLAGIVAQAASGEALYRGSTFLAGREGEPVASSLLSIDDDPTLPGQLGSRPFDGEGVATRRNPLLEAGVFRGFLFDCYNARRLNAVTTGSAVRDVGGLPMIGSGNLIIAAGETPAEQIVGDVKDGLYLTTLMGFGINLTTGDFSRGAAGIRIRNGELAEPVSEINVSGNLREMLRGIDALGDDQQWFGQTAAPTVRIERMTISGV